MKYLIVFLFVLLACSCSNDDNLALKPFMTQYVDSVDVNMTEFIDLGLKPKAMQGMKVFGRQIVPVL